MTRSSGCPDTVRAQTARPMEQRSNVALSRARDHMVLVRSVAASMLSPSNLKLAVIEHFRKPMGDVAIAQSKNVLDACDSDFELDVGKRLLDRGYRVRPQVQVGAYRIDFVIEGEGDRRLAVELDGDKYHPPEKWAADLHRQRALERLGWVFWRCWGSHWLSDRQGCLDDLLATLTRMEIRPVGGSYMPQAVTEHRVVGAEPLGAAAQEVSAASGHPVLATVNPGPAAAPIAPVGPEHSADAMVEVGDTVIVRFADDNRIRRFRLSSDATDLEQGVVHVGQAIGLALLGSGIEEEVDPVVGGRTGRVIIEKITKAP